ncbi:flagellar protein FlaG [Accumulibacter sp.]|uniref:flagellar protein FlaG n=1 Tax=Accumulibacter sp. TaxID=2053492 RepID=UPI0025F941D6|nr:flagellar protein FlaG [Accumulibacter sp.]MCM8596750.1 flagellar protein FlaG [Accumulibacter sp.]MCM8624716.1 flagellar protein FlaG [Accumulibacter sp.]MDS4050899.1 flagellar protein FlaG [Accumulibacter sp.]
MNIQPTGAALTHQANTSPGAPPREVRVPAEQALRSPDSPQAAAAEAAVDRRQLEVATKSVRDFVEPINSNLEFSINADTRQLVVKIIDRTTKEVIRQIPSAEMLALAKALDSIKGLFVRQTA